MTALIIDSMNISSSQCKRNEEILKAEELQRGEVQASVQRVFARESNGVEVFVGPTSWLESSMTNSSHT